jgi:hypothetical protein
VHALLASKSLRVSVVVALVSAAVLLLFRHVNPGHGAEHYFMHENRALYRVMQVCHVVIVASCVFNAKFALGAAVAAASAST